MANGDRSCTSGRQAVMVLSLSIEPGDSIRISAAGEQEQEAVESLIALVEHGFAA